MKATLVQTSFTDTKGDLLNMRPSSHCSEWNMARKKLHPGNTIAYTSRANGRRCYMCQEGLQTPVKIR